MWFLFKKEKKLNERELNDIHKFLSDLYDGKRKFQQTELDDILYLRMRVKRALDEFR